MAKRLRWGLEPGPGPWSRFVWSLGQVRALLGRFAPCRYTFGHQLFFPLRVTSDAGERYTAGALDCGSSTSRPEGRCTCKCRGLPQRAGAALTAEIFQGSAAQAVIEEREKKKGKVKGRFTAVLVGILV